MRLPPRVVLRGLLKFVAVALAAGVVGAGLGIALAELTGNDDVPTPLAPQNESSPRTATDMATATTATSTTASTQPAGGSRTTRVQIQSAVLYPAGAPDGEDPQRARVVIRVRVTSRSVSPIPRQTPMLIVGSSRVRADPDSADALLRQIAPGETATGELHFETTGSATQRLANQRRARLRIAQRTVNVNDISISSRSAPPG